MEKSLAAASFRVWLPETRDYVARARDCVSRLSFSNSVWLVCCNREYENLQKVMNRKVREAKSSIPGVQGAKVQGPSAPERIQIWRQSRF
eukprot:3987770-Pyramimonas_sp.AAC.2